jgi:cyclic beta-1,2-glucan synthetase
MYRSAIEGILGFHLRGTTLSINPCIPRAWNGFEITYKHGSSRYHIAVDNPNGVCRGIVRVLLDDREISRTACDLSLVDDGHFHYARIMLG